MAPMDMSGSFRWPTLIDYLVLLDEEDVSVGLRLWIGALEVGFVGVETGQVCVARMPGVDGRMALGLLAELPGVRVVPEPWIADERNVEGHWEGHWEGRWRELVDWSVWESLPDRTQRLGQVREELEAIRSGSEPTRADSGSNEDGDDRRRARALAAGLLRWVGIEAYLDGDLEGARGFLSGEAALLPGEIVTAANLERLRVRLLEDELAASVLSLGERR